MADDAELSPPPARNVVAHQCTHCRCPGVEDLDLRRNASSSSEASVSTGTASFLPAAEVGLNGSVCSGGARHRGPAGFGAPNGAVIVDIDGGFAESSGVVRESARGGGIDDDDDDVLYVADIVANNLHELNSGRYPKLKHAFEDWERSLKESLKRRKSKEAQEYAIVNEIYQLIGFYSISQGVLLTAVTQTSMLRCHNWWISSVLSLLMSLITVGGGLQKLQALAALEITIAGEIATAKVLKNRISDVKLKVGPARFNFKKHALDAHYEGLKKTRSSVQLFRVVVITGLLLFSVLFPAASWSILCRAGSSPSS